MTPEERAAFDLKVAPVRRRREEREAAAVGLLDHVDWDEEAVDGPWAPDAVEVSTPWTPEAQADPSALAAAMRGRLLTATDLLALPPPAWLVDDLVPAGSFTMLRGASGDCKTFVAVAVACCVASGRPWHGHAVRRGRVLYIVLEGKTGIGQRIEAWCDYEGVALADLDLVFHPGPVNLHTGLDALGIAELVAEDRYALVVIDTLARAAVGADENSARDMGAVVAGVSMAVDRGAAAILVHHVGKDAQRGARGSSAIRAAVDAELAVTASRGTVKVTVAKQKDAVEGPPVALRLIAHGNSAVLIDPPATDGADPAGFRPTTLMERVSEALEGSLSPLSKNKVRHLVTGRNEHVDRALDCLVTEGHVSEQPGHGGAEYVHARPYRAAMDPLSDAYVPLPEDTSASREPALDDF